ncbi:hypothetical protein MXD63_43705, partial [Frankia sp. Cpl3]|nr:hypothetical protein [Frankia sp. Cpl3]
KNIYAAAFFPKNKGGKMEMKKTASIFSAFLAAALLVTGCSSSQTPTNKESAGGTQQAPAQQPAAPTDQGPKILNLNNLQEPTSLDPPIGFDQISYDI